MVNSRRKLSERLALSLATVAGREHRRTGRNNQDAVAAHVDDRLAIAAVADGCSGAKRSEVGAHLMVSWLVRRVPALVQARGELCPDLLADVRANLSTYLHQVARGLADESSPGYRSALGELLLATFLVAIAGPERVLVFGVGDGLVLVDGERVFPLGEPSTAPDYLAYGLLPDWAGGPGATPSPLAPIWEGRSDSLESLLIATDGAHSLEAAVVASPSDGRPFDGLDELFDAPRYARNATLLQKRLRVLAEVPGLLHDDTTMALVRPVGR